MCLKNGRWPHKHCRNVFNDMPSKQTCTPNSYVIEGCNVCHCGPSGKIDRKHCTQNDCSEIITSRRLNKVNGNCEPGNWYSLAPCQFCYCVNENKLVCSTGNNKLNEILELGAYNLTVCGKQMIKEVIELAPEVLKSLRSGKNSPTEEVMTQLTTRPATAETVLPKPAILHTKHKKSQGMTIDDGKQDNRDEKENVKNMNQIDKDADSDSNSDDDISIARARKPTRPLPKRHQPVTTPIPYQEDKTSEESTVSDKPNISGETKAISVNKKAHLQIPLSAKLTFENVMETQEAKPDLDNAASKDTKDDVYKVNIPSVLDKILSMSMKRRSMVKLNTQSNCVPGETKKVDCNNCFCLTNGKLLCTHKSCNGITSEPQ